MRRKNLVEALLKNGMFPTDAIKEINKHDLWKLRSIAPVEQISLPELGRILLWLNQKRGYKSSRSDANLDKKNTQYVEKVNSRHKTIKALEQTIGQYFYNQILENEYIRIKEQIFPREAYLEEYDAIMQCQRQFHSTLTEDLIAKIRNQIIYYQRALKSQKGLVSICEFEGRDYNGHFGGPRVAPKSSPLFQVAKIWENVNNIAIEDTEITAEQKLEIFNYLNQNEKITEAKLRSLLRLPKNTRLNKQLKNGLTGNKSYAQIASCFGNKIKQYKELFRFDLDVVESDTAVFTYDRKSGEVMGEKSQKYISQEVEKEPYYRLWHAIYSIKEKSECESVLIKKFNIEQEIAHRLASLDLSVAGFGNKSAKVIRRILPYLMDGEVYSVAMDYAGYNHSAASITSQENLSRTLEDSLKHLPKNSLRQPIVERILNQMINLVNSIMERYGRMDEIRVELARELKQSKDERNETDRFMKKREGENKDIKESLAQYGLKDTRNNIIKWRLYHEIDDKDKKLNARCIYCGQALSLTEAILGNGVDVEHIIPKKLIFDDSQSNKTLAHRHCNSGVGGKGDQTAYDYMKSKSVAEFEDYVQRVKELYNRHLISSAKYKKLMMTRSEIPNDFIDRQLRESQYIARKSREILQTVSRNVWATGGGVTAHLRKLWGWGDVTMNLQMPKYQELGLTTTVEWESEHGRNQHSAEVIQGWSKRDDHRHHAIDALVIACTKQGYIQRMNTLNSSDTRDEMYNQVIASSVEFKEKQTLLNKYLITEQPLTTAQVQDAVSKILISFKAGKKAAVLGTRKIGRRGNKQVVQKGIIVPRGALSEGSIYGKIKVTGPKKVNYIFENPHLIVKLYIKALVEERLAKFEGDSKSAIASLKKDPIYLDDDKKTVLEWASCYSEHYIVKYKVDTGFSKVSKVIDKPLRAILETRLSKFNGKPADAFKDVKNDDESISWWEDEGLKIPIYSVRCYTGLSAVVPVKRDENGVDIGFVMPGNNHHIAIYRDADGVRHEHLVTLWSAVERKKNGLPFIIKNPDAAYEKIENRDDISDQFLSQLPDPTWTFELSMQQNEMFVMGMSDVAFEEAIATQDYATLSNYLYRVQKLSARSYYFRSHLETKIDNKFDGESNEMLSKEIGKVICISSVNRWADRNPKKVKISILGEIEVL